jgi:hypothetical protein
VGKKEETFNVKTIGAYVAIVLAALNYMGM